MLLEQKPKIGPPPGSSLSISPPFYPVLALRQDGREGGSEQLGIGVNHTYCHITGIYLC